MSVSLRFLFTFEEKDSLIESHREFVEKLEIFQQIIVRMTSVGIFIVSPIQQ